jgi:hypothetical protein
MSWQEASPAFAGAAHSRSTVASSLFLKASKAASGAAVATIGRRTAATAARAKYHFPDMHPPE